MDVSQDIIISFGREVRLRFVWRISLRRPGQAEMLRERLSRSRAAAATPARGMMLTVLRNLNLALTAYEKRT